MEILILYFIGALLGLIVVLHYVLKSLERALDRMFPTPYDQKGERGGGYEYPEGVRSKGGRGKGVFFS